MPINFYEDTRTFKLDTPNSTYSFFVTEEGLLYHTYYGKFVPDTDLICLANIKSDFTTGRVSNSGLGALAKFRFEYVPYNTGDWGEPSVIVADKNGNPTTDFYYVGHRIYAGKEPLAALPATFSAEEGDVSSLEIYLEDKLTGLKITLKYSVFEKLDAITRSVLLENMGQDTLVVRRALSSNIDLANGSYDMIALHGDWARESFMERLPIRHGNQAVSSCEGKTSHATNNFYAVCDSDATETHGNVYGSCLVYSGNFVSGVGLGCSEYPRMYTGINPVGFSWELGASDTFQTPEAILVYSSEGIGGMSRTFHDVIRTHIIRSPWKHRCRPVLINNWEATYFDFNTEKLLSIARQAKDAGIEMFVLDDGWFGCRNDDSNSLGDWFVFEEKFPGGFGHLVDEINKLGMKFGLWFEPEMISPNSELYRAHPDWCLHVKGRDGHLGRRQLVLDYSRKEVRDHIYAQMHKLLSTANIEYVKWDHNRSWTEVGNEIEGYHSQGSIAHKMMLGVYDIMNRLVTDFPNLILENCAGGGGRFDAGMLYYSPQIWASDDSDAIMRLSIQHGLSLCYPCMSMGSHVSICPNHQTGRYTPIETRCAVALPGAFGYELDLTKVSDAEKAMIPDQIELYKKYNDLTREGDYFRLANPTDSDKYSAWQFVSKDKSEALVELVSVLYRPSVPNVTLKLRGLDPEAVYADDNGNKYSGALLMNAGIVANGSWGDFKAQILHFTKCE